MLRKFTAFVPRYRKFESISLQRGVRNELTAQGAQKHSGREGANPYTIGDRSGLIAEFLSESISAKDFPDTTWHLDPEALEDFKSFVNVALWRSAKDFHDQVAKHYNDTRPMRPYEMYRRRRVVAESNDWRIGQFQLPDRDSPRII